MTPAQEGRPLHTTDEIAKSYDAQSAESFAFKQGTGAEFFERYGRAVGRELAKLNPCSVLDAGCGDGVVLKWALGELKPGFVAHGMDLSKDRIKLACSILPMRKFYCGSFDDMIFLDGSYSVVFTSHAMEPNGGRAIGILRELKRVARRHVVLFEPDYDAAPPEGKARMERLNYVCDIRQSIAEVGFTVEKDEPFPVIGNKLNPTNLWVLGK